MNYETTIAVRYLSPKQIRDLLLEADAEHSKEMQEELEEARSEADQDEWDDEDEGDRQWDS